MAGQELSYSQYGYYAPIASPLVRRMFLAVTDDEQAIQLAVYPGDTLGQARALYRTPEVLERLRELARLPGWTVVPNFHFGFAARGFVWTSGPIQLDPYIDLFQQRIDDEYELDEADWDDYWDGHVATGVIDPGSRAKFDNEFTNTYRTTAQPRPGLAIVKRWPLGTAQELDEAGLFIEEVRQAAAIELSVCDAEFDAPVSRTP